MAEDDLNKRIAEAQAQIDAREKPSAQAAASRGMSVGFRMAADFSAAVIVGAVLGLGIDALFKVSPWGTIICLMLGFVAGVRNVVATAAKANQASGPDAVEKGESKTR